VNAGARVRLSCRPERGPAIFPTLTRSCVRRVFVEVVDMSRGLEEGIARRPFRTSHGPVEELSIVVELTPEQAAALQMVARAFLDSEEEMVRRMIMAYAQTIRDARARGESPTTVFLMAGEREAAE
jgi:hypothetical protein